MSDYVSTEELAKIYGICEEVARRWCRKGKIEAKKINGRWYVKKDMKNKDECKHEETINVGDNDRGDELHCIKCGK